jgi:hypothetical protein
MEVHSKVQLVSCFLPSRFALSIFNDLHISLVSMTSGAVVSVTFK